MNRSSEADLIENDLEVLSKLFSDKSYEKKDMEKCVKNIYIKCDFKYEQQVRVIEDVEGIRESELKETTLFLFNKHKYCWVLICLILEKGGWKILYKDSCGASVPKDLENKLKKKFTGVKIIKNNSKDQDEYKTQCYGPLCLRNLKIVLDLCKKDAKSLVNDFTKIQFFKEDKLNNAKVNIILKLSEELSRNADFIKRLEIFIKTLPLGLDRKYKKALEEELCKDEKDVNLDRIKKERKKFLAEIEARKFQEVYKIIEGQNSNYKLAIEKKFPEQMKKLEIVFKFFDNLQVDEHLFYILEIVCSLLKIDGKKIKCLYEAKRNEKHITEKIKLIPDDINEIAKKLSPINNTQAKDFIPVEKLLPQVALGMDHEDSSNSKVNDMKRLKEKYYQVKKNYEHWKNHDVFAVNKLAQGMKGKLNNTDNVICNTIALMDRVWNLLHGFRLRNTQILAALIFFHNQNNHGRLCQIQTGEGKTIIVALLAVIRALQGHKVDVITSNSLLAADGVKEMKKFYSVFGLTVSTNNVDEESNDQGKIGYTADILYGTISNFQFDYLKDTFEGFNLRSEREFGQVILDEVDSMLVDNGGHIAKLASPYPGMESLRYIYIKIWEEVLKAEKSLAEEVEAKIKLILKSHANEDEATKEYDKYLEGKVRDERAFIEQKIIDSDPTNIPLIPPHLKNYARRKLKIWVKSALHAKYNCHEHQQYRIITNDVGERVVAPVDYLNTGVTLKNTIWSNGLHQFIQLKHNLYLTFESLTSSFISNIGYIKNYDDKNIFGLTGTLGSRAEQKLLSKIYNIDYAKLPTYKPKQFKEIPGVIAEDDSWHIQLILEIISKVDQGRAVLVICETEEDLLIIENDLKIIQDDSFRVRLYANEGDAKETREKVKIGDIILATNIAGRGTNFKTEKDLEANGGLHVCVGFLPCNLRVEGQAFGRTSRQGNNGTAQLVIRQSEVDELEIEKDNTNFTDIKQKRDSHEAKRLEEIKNSLVKELNFKDKLFGIFSSFYLNFKRSRNTREYMYLLEDLKEFWAFWLEKKDFCADNITKTPEQEFDNFITEAQPIIGRNGKITQNPFYCISLADYFLETDARDKARSELNRAIKLTANQNFKLLAGAHLKLFEIAMADEEQIKKRAIKALKKVVLIPVNSNDNNNYKKKAKQELEQAQMAIESEINYITKYLTLDNTPSDLATIIIPSNGENLLLKHIYSRMNCLTLHRDNIKDLIDTINKTDDGVDISGKVSINLENLSTIDTNFKALITNFEVNELQSIGIDALYSLKEIHDVPDAVIETARLEIVAGISILTAGFCFPPAFAAVSGLAGTLISDGIMDITMELVSQGTEEFNSQEYWENKQKFYGLSLLTFGLNVVTQCVTILTKALSFCRKISSFLRQSTKMRKVCDMLLKLVDKLEKYLLKLLEAAQVAHNLNRSQMVKVFLKDSILKRVKSKGKSIIKEEIVQTLIKAGLGRIISEIVDQSIMSLKNSIKERPTLLNKLRTTDTSIVNAKVDKFLEMNTILKYIDKIMPKLIGLLKNKLGNRTITILSLTSKEAINLHELYRYNKKFALDLDGALKGGKCHNNVDDVIGEICTKLDNQISSLLVRIFQDCVDGVKDVGKGFIKSNGSKEDSYAVLRLQPDASPSEIKQTYIKLTLNAISDDDKKQIKAAYKVVIGNGAKKN
jgi:preprotein translocase subunit SecA/tetratricopeptide (TPR) repeat protein